MMEPELKDEVAGSIPHMHLFMYLKRRFPALKDADITDAIQRFGLDKIRCEDELSRRNEEQHQGYNSPWNRSRTSSRGSLSSRNSPLSPSETHSYTSSPLQNGSSPSTPTSSQPHYYMNPCFSSSDKENFTLLYKNPLQSGETKGTHTCAASTKESCTFPADLSHWKYSSPQLADSGCGRSSSGSKFPEEKSSATRASSESRTTFPGERSPEPQSAHERPSPANNISPQHNMSSPINPISSASNVNVISPPVEDFQNAQNSIPAAIDEQLARKQRLKDELNCQMGEKMKLESEVKTMADDLETREASQRLDVIRSKKEIELIQQENSKLQFICDEMEREILESGESPKTDQEGRARGPPLRIASSPNDYSGVAAPLQEQTHRPQQPLPRANSASSLLSSGAVVSPMIPLIPSRTAPSPPGTAKSPPSSMGRNFEQVTQRPATIGSDESRKEWSCSKCTFINSPYLNECEICGFPHFSVGTPPHLPPSQAHPPNPGGPCYCHHRRHLSQGQEPRNATHTPP